jgi:hypothetical protein
MYIYYKLNLHMYKYIYVCIMLNILLITVNSHVPPTAVLSTYNSGTFGNASSSLTVLTFTCRRLNIFITYANIHKLFYNITTNLQEAFPVLKKRFRKPMHEFSPVLIFTFSIAFIITVFATHLKCQLNKKS